MKKILLSVAIIFMALLSVFAQDTRENLKVYKNEIGVDITGFIRQFFFYSDGTCSPSAYKPNYIVNYRRHLKSGNIRFAIGGNFNQKDLNSPYDDDDSHYLSKQYYVNARIGWEFTKNINVRWQVFYGLDMLPSFSYSKNDANYWDGGYANGSENTNKTIGIGPIFGIKFKVSKRINISTVTNFAIFLSQNDETFYYTPLSSDYPPIPDDKQQLTSIYSGYNQAMSILLSINL